MKPLSKNDLKTFMHRFDSAKGGELVSFEILNPSCFAIALTVQDTNRAFDWVNLVMEFSGVSEAKLLDDKALKAVDMQEGMNISFTEEGVLIGFGSDEYLSSPLHLRAETVKYEESDFKL
jgi:hypothetical protein